LNLPLREAPTMSSPNAATILRDQVRLSITSFDRLYLGGYVPTLQTPGQVVAFCRDHLRQPIASPALFRPLRERFIQAVHAFADQHQVPIVPFTRGQRKDDVAAWYRARFSAQEGVVLIGVAQERARALRGRRAVDEHGRVSFEFARETVAVNHYYFYVQDREWGPAFIKVGSYLPYPVRVCLNGHDWAKQQLRHEGIAFEALDNGFRWCADPERLQALCDALGPAEVQAFFRRWVQRLPWPLDAAARAAGYAHALSLWQVEVSLTQVFAEPTWGRRFFEAVIRENLDLGRPDRVSLLFPARLTRATPAPAFGYRTRVITRGVQPSLHVDFKHSHVKQYLKQGWALRTETTFNDPTDVQPTKALATLPHLREVGQQINTRLLQAERLSVSPTVPERPLIERVQQPIGRGPRRAPALRLGDARVLALLQALCQVAPRPDGFRHRQLRPVVASLLGRELTTYSANAMTYDLRRLRRHGLIQRIAGSFRYTVTPDGLHLAFGLCRLYARLLQPSWAALLAPSATLPPVLRQALAQLDAALDQLRPTPTTLPMAA
jgi:hypothetical protein